MCVYDGIKHSLYGKIVGTDYRLDKLKYIVSN